MTAPIAFFDIGFGEMVVVGLVALVLFGGRLPEVMRNLGGMYRNFRRGMEDLRDSALNPKGLPPGVRDPYRPRGMTLPGRDAMPVPPAAQPMAPLPPPIAAPAATEPAAGPPQPPLPGTAPLQGAPERPPDPPHSPAPA